MEDFIVDAERIVGVAKRLEDLAVARRSRAPAALKLGGVEITTPLRCEYRKSDLGPPFYSATVFLSVFTKPLAKAPVVPDP